MLIALVFLREYYNRGVLPIVDYEDDFNPTTTSSYTAFVTSEKQLYHTTDLTSHTAGIIASSDHFEAFARHQHTVFMTSSKMCKTSVAGDVTQHHHQESHYPDSSQSTYPEMTQLQYPHQQTQVQL